MCSGIYVEVTSVLSPLLIFFELLYACHATAWLPGARNLKTDEDQRADVFSAASLEILSVVHVLGVCFMSRGAF